MPNCRRCKIPLKPVRKVIGPKDAVIVGYRCDKCRYYDPLWSAVGLDQNGIGGKGPNGGQYNLTKKEANK